MKRQTNWTVVFLLLAAGAMFITPVAGSLAVIAWVAAGMFLVLAFIFQIKRGNRNDTNK
jgi:hypothetical protein